MNDLILHVDVSEKLDKVIRNYVSQINLLHALVSTNSGQILVSFGKDDAIDISSLPPLISGSFSATEKIADLIGEKEFTTMLHQGSQRTILITLIDFNLYLTTIFDNSHKTETIRHAASSFAKKLRDFLLKYGISSH